LNTGEYIESGTLDLYIAGLLSVEEMRDVELKACQYPEVKTELQSLQSAFEKYAMKFAIAPPSGLKEKIMREISGNASRQEKPIVRQIAPAQRSYTGLLAAASVALLIFAAAMAWHYVSMANQYKEQTATLTQQQLMMQKEVNGMKESLDKNKAQLAMMMDPATIKIPMKGTAMAPQSLAMIYWNKNSRSVYLDVKSLPANSSDKQYQLWFIDPHNHPVSAGVFDAENGMFMKMVDAADAVAFAVTLEPRGGSVNPTMDQMYVIGKVSG
jgi:anti-sigma-K factor RskA